MNKKRIQLQSYSLKVFQSVQKRLFDAAVKSFWRSMKAFLVLRKRLFGEMKEPLLQRREAYSVR